VVNPNKRANSSNRERLPPPRKSNLTTRRKCMLPSLNKLSNMSPRTINSFTSNNKTKDKHRMAQCTRCSSPSLKMDKWCKAASKFTNKASRTSQLTSNSNACNTWTMGIKLSGTVKQRCNNNRSTHSSRIHRSTCQWSFIRSAKF